MPNVSKIIDRITPSITIAITAKARKMIEDGVDVVDLGVGEPDFDTPSHISDAGIDAIRSGRTKYTSAYGIDQLRKAICEKFRKENNLYYEPDQIILSSGAKHSISTVLQAISNPGDEVIVPLPYWVSYPEMVKLAGANPVTVKTSAANGFKITARQLQESIGPRTKALLLNSPSNPTGSVYSRKELLDIAQVIVDRDIFVISDEIYEKMVYDQNEHVSIASLGQDIKALTIVINGMSKAYAMTGWRLGYAAAEREVIRAMGTVQGHAISHPSSITQYAAVAALNGDQSVVTMMVNEYGKRRRYMMERLDSINGIEYVFPQGAFYVYVSLKEILGRAYQSKVIESSMDFCRLLLEEAKVAAIPGKAFGDDGYLRISYATSMERIKMGMDRIQSLVDSILH
jgi:aspartate aminotransferase